MAGEIKLATDKLTATLRNGRDIIEKHGGSIATNAGFAEVIYQSDQLMTELKQNQKVLQSGKEYKAIITDALEIYPDTGYDGLLALTVSTQLKHYQGDTGRAFWDQIAPPTGTWYLEDCDFYICGDYIFGNLYYKNSAGVVDSNNNQTICKIERYDARCAAPDYITVQSNSYIGELFFSSDGISWTNQLRGGLYFSAASDESLSSSFDVRLPTGITLDRFKASFGYKMYKSWEV